VWIEEFEKPFTGLGEDSKLTASSVSEKFMVTSSDK